MKASCYGAEIDVLATSAKPRTGPVDAGIGLQAPVSKFGRLVHGAQGTEGTGSRLIAA
jgi:hypothetical protein